MPHDKLAQTIFLPELKLTAIKRKKKRRGMLCLVAKTSVFEVCPRCATPSSTVYDHRRVTVHDAPIRGMDVKLVINKRRFSCKKCQKPFTEPVSGVSKGSRTTERFRKHVLWASRNFADLKKAARHCRCSTGFLYKNFYSELERNIKAKSYPWPQIIGIDEHLYGRHKGRKNALEFATIVADYKNKRIFELADGREKDALTGAFGRIPSRGNVKWAVIDMSTTFLGFIKSNFKNAQVVVDKFHVLQLFTKALRRKRIDTTGDKRRHPIRGLLQRDGRKLSRDERGALNVWLNTHPDVRELYELKEAFLRWYRRRSYEKVTILFSLYLGRMAHSKQTAVKKLRATLVKWRREILNYFLTGLTNARTEAYNNIAKLIQKRAFGFRSFRNYRLRLLGVHRG